MIPPDQPAPPGPLCPRTQRSVWIGIVMASVALGVLYVWLAIAWGARNNMDWARGDQSAYLREARDLRESHYAQITPRNRMPIYLYLLSVVYSPDLSDADNFARGKMMNVYLSLAALLAIGALLFRTLPSLAAFNLLWITAFSVFVRRAAYVQVELLFYTLCFFAVFLTARLLRRWDWLTAVLTGAALASAYLAKASATLIPIAFVVVLVGQTIYESTWKKQVFTGVSLVRRWGMALLMLAMCIAILLPYLLNSKRVYGRYLYNVNLTFYLWYDNWDQAKAGTRAHGDRVGWPDMPASQIPSATRYWQTHSLQQIWRRESAGLGTIFHDLRASAGYGKYLLLYALIAALAALDARSSSPGAPRCFRADVAAFALVGTGAYLVASAFYSTIARPERLVLADFLPVAFGLCWIGMFCGPSTRPWRAGRWKFRAGDLQWLLTAMLAIDLALHHTTAM